MSGHVSVLLQECIEGLQIKADGIYVDATLGRGGHSSEILKRCPQGHLYAFDRDIEAIHQSAPRLLAISDRFTLLHARFSQMKSELAAQGIHRVDGILMDLGVSSPQLDEAKRGFSYRYDAPLDMRMDQSQQLDAWHVVNTYSYEELCRVLFTYGEEPFAKAIARRIEQSRQQHSIDTTFALADIIRDALPARVRSKKGHPAKKSFQAIRIEVNSELQELKEALTQAMELLNVNGRLCVISFHSLEDRIVKEAFAQAGKPPKVNKRLPVTEEEQLHFQLITRKPITAKEEELADNNRSHSAKLRIIEKVRES